MEIPLLDLYQERQSPKYFQTKDSKYFSANILKKITFNWIYPMIKLGNQTYLEQDMHDDLHPSHKSIKYFNDFNANWRIFKDISTRPLIRSIFSTFKSEILLCMFIELLSSSYDIGFTLLIKLVVGYVGQAEKDIMEGVQILTLVILIKVLSIFVKTNALYYFTRLGQNISNSLSLSIFDKALKISLLSNKEYDNGKMVNMMTTDSGRIMNICEQLTDLLYLPLQLVFGFTIIYMEIGISFVFGILVMIVMGGVNYQIGRKSVSVQKLNMVEKDKRVKIATEIFSSIKFVKVNAWEEYFYDKLDVQREKELGFQRKKMVLQLGQITSSYLTPVLITNITFAYFILSGNLMSAENAFVVLNLFKTLQTPIQDIPKLFASLVETSISIKRIQAYLLTEEVSTGFIKQIRGENALTMIKGNFNWGRKFQEQGGEGSGEILKDLNLKIKKGSMVAFIGDVGSGKSSFLYSLLGEMRPADGCSLLVDGSYSIVNQKPWIMNLTVRDNILFGLPFDQQKYKDCLKFSCLETDLTILQQGDETMIGESGVNLSGGQKVRIALARALYSETDILLLDDVMSAVDIHVGLNIMKECLMIYKSNTTRILVTHALSYMKYMDYIYLMDQGQIIAEGRYQDMRNSPHFKIVYEKYVKEFRSTETETPDLVEQMSELEVRYEEAAKLEGTEKSTADLDDKLEIIKLQKTSKGGKYDDIILKEDRMKGSINKLTFQLYFHMQGGWPFFLLFFSALCIQQGLRVFSNIWMTFWADDIQHEKQEFYIFVYFFLSFGYVVFIALREVILFIFSFSMQRQIHQNMTACLLYAPLNEFFERIPLGRILNRFTKDISCIDEEIYWDLDNFFLAIMNIAYTAIMNMFSSTPYIAIPIFFYVLIGIKIQKFYYNAQREITRLESITKSPIISFFQESLNGLTSIRAYNQTERFFNQLAQNIDENSKNQITQIAMTQWFRQRLSLLSIFINIISTAFCLFSSSTTPAQSGLLIAYAFSLDLNVRALLNNLSRFQNRLVSFERCTAYTQIESEHGCKEYLTHRNFYKNYQLKPHENLQMDKWPVDGVIEFRQVCVRYRQDLDPVLKGLTFIVYPNEKIGVVGRTGAGKSTITLSLLRVLELFNGQILIDGFNIAQLCLHELRQKITIILQDPSLFEGTLRENIDPLHLYTDSHILDTLKQCNLNYFLESREGLSTAIQDGSANLSVGEKQLICIARSLLKKSKVVLIDEATANIDIKTEQLIQNTLRNIFKDCTVLTIAHRINTIMSCDRIIVMREGRIVEFDKPQVLLQNPDSLFKQIYESSHHRDAIE